LTPLLTLSWVAPLVGAILLLLIPNRDGRRDSLVKWLALGISTVAFVLTLGLWFWFDQASSEFQFVERVPWIPAFGIDYYVGLDGISLLLVILTSFLTPIALLSSWEGVEHKVKEFCVFILALEAAMIGVFISLDLFLFYVFWDAMLIPMYFLIGIWGYDRRIYAAGDVVGGRQFTHLSDAHARIVLRNALFFGRAKASALTVPECTFTDPEVARVGHTLASAAAAGRRARAFEHPFDAVTHHVVPNFGDETVSLIRPGNASMGGNVPGADSQSYGVNYSPRAPGLAFVMNRVRSEIAVVDTDKDGRLASAEHATGARTMFATMDVDADGVLTVAEVRAGHDKAMGGEASP